MRLYDISQLPMLEGDILVGFIDKWDLLSHVEGDSRHLSLPVKEAMTRNVGRLDKRTPESALKPLFYRGQVAVIVDRQKFPCLVTRSDVLTRHALETAIAELEGGTRGYAFASGLTASATVLELLDKDSHIIAVDDVYGGTYRLVDNVRRHSAGHRVSWINPDNLLALEAAIRPDTRMIWVETPTNPLLKLADLAAIADIAHRHKLISVADNTFASPAIQRPIPLGFDIVVHSATKYLNGHSDVVAGLAVVGNRPELADKSGYLQNAVGGVESLVSQPFSMTHASIPLEQRLAGSITPQLIRLSVSIEDPQDLINDLRQTLTD